MIGGSGWEMDERRIHELGLATSISTEKAQAMNFLSETFQLIAEDNANPQRIHSVWTQQQERLNAKLIEVLPEIVTPFLESNSEHRMGVALILVRFGNLIQRFSKGTRWLNLELAITAYELALQVYSRELHREQWATTQNNLAIAYSDRIQGTKADNLEKSIVAYQSVLEVQTLDIKQWAMVQNNLAATYADRIRGDRTENLEQAITGYNLALKIRTRDAFPEQWATTQNNLANAYVERIRGDHTENLEYAITRYKLALQVRTCDAFPEQWATTQNNLANAYADTTIRGDHIKNLEQAIIGYELALQARTHGASPEIRGMIQNNLGITYRKRIQGDPEENSEYAIIAYQSALQVLTHNAFPEKWAKIQNNLASAYSTRIRGERADNLERATTAGQFALEVYTHNAFPKECRQTSQDLGNLYFEQQNWKSATDIYTNALVAAEILYQSCLLLENKAAELRMTSGLPRRAAYVYAKTGDIRKAALTLEGNRARGLSNSLDRDRANLTQLQKLAPNLYTQYQDIIIQLRNIESQERDLMTNNDRHSRDRNPTVSIDFNSITPEVLRNEAIRLRSDLEETIAQIRQVPTYEDFLTPTKWEDIAIALRSKNSLIYIVTTSHGSMALMATDDAIEVLWLNDLTETKLVNLLNKTWFAAYNNSQTDRQTWHNTIESTTRQLWDLLMGPIVQQLKTMGIDRATLIPTGYLSLLPLHAAWTLDPDRPTGKRYAIDDIHFTYTPNARSLTEARKIADRPFADSILAIDNPRQDLPNSQREIDCAIASFSDRHILLRHEEAKIDAVKAGLQKAAIVHFSCHGTANFTEPLNSGLLMSDGLLTLKDLLALNLAQDNGIRLAILSACETGLPGLDNIDEVVSLPIGLLQAGVAGVISSLWSVSDLSTMLLLTKFYELWRERKLPPDQALRQAQIWLRDSTNAEKVIEFKNTIDQTRMPAFTAQQLFDELAWETKNERSFNHPFHWAAFSYTGI